MKKVFVGLALAVALLVPTSALAGTGGPGDDVIYGTSGGDTIYGGSGNDVIFARAGADTIYAGPGNDVIHSGLGADSIWGGGGFDICYVSNADAVSGCEVTK